MGIHRHLAALIAEAGLLPRNVRVEFDTVNPDHYRFLLGTGCSSSAAGGWRRRSAASAWRSCRRPTWRSNTNRFHAARRRLCVADLRARLEELPLISTRRHSAAT